MGEMTTFHHKDTKFTKTPQRTTTAILGDTPTRAVGRQRQPAEQRRSKLHYFVKKENVLNPIGHRPMWWISVSVRKWLLIFSQKERTRTLETAAEQLDFGANFKYAGRSSSFNEFLRAKMEVQYVYDEEGRQTGVIVPIGLWNKISHMAVNVQAERTDWIPSKYRGMYKDLKIDVKEESKALRDEWTRMSKDIS
jgi:hypothetical protein